MRSARGRGASPSAMRAASAAKSSSLAYCPCGVEWVGGQEGRLIRRAGKGVVDVWAGGQGDEAGPAHGVSISDS